MKFQIASTLIATCIACASAETKAQKFASTAPQKIVAGTPAANKLMETPNKIEKKKGSRLLHTLQKRKERAYQRHLGELQSNAAESNANPDVGILSSSKTSDPPRFLADYDYYCPRDTCPTELCDCADAGGSLEDCSPQLQNVCNAGRLSDCVFEEYVAVYQEVYCPWTMCLGQGSRLNQCDCAFYEMYCTRLNSEECENVSVEDDEDNKIFGCDKTEIASVCDQAKECKAKGDLNGLPDLGSWQGSAMIGIPKSSGERRMGVGGGGMVAGVTMLSMLWCLINV